MIQSYTYTTLKVPENRDPVLLIFLFSAEPNTLLSSKTCSITTH